jgi:lysophospholipase L1-like esterase
MLRAKLRRLGEASGGAVLWNLLLGLCTAGVMLLGLEFALRLVWSFADPRTSVVTALENKADPSAKRILLPTRFVDQLGSSQRYALQSNVLTYPDSRLLFHVRPNPTGQPVYCYEGIDAQGYRTAGLLERQGRMKTRAVRILLLGDSCAFGWGICPFEQTIGAQLEHILATDRDKAEVINLAQPGYSTAQGLLLFRYWFPELRPDFVVLYFGWNDVFPTLGMTDTEVLRVMPIAASPLAQRMMKTALYKTFAWVASASHLEPRDPPAESPTATRVRVPLDESIANVRAMIEASNAVGARVLIIVPPHGVQFRHRELDIDNFNRAIAASLHGNATLVTLPNMETGDYEAASYFTRDGFHPNARGAHYIADALAAAIIRQPSKRLTEGANIGPAGAAVETLPPEDAAPTAVPTPEPAA